MDTRWSEAAEDWQRVKWAREAAGFDTMRAAAQSLKMGENTYSAYERDPSASKTTRLNDPQRAIQFGRKFRVSWSWLLTGEGTPFDRPANPPQERVIRAMSAFPEDRQDDLANAVEALLKSVAA
jgi:hypothetical protein